MKKYIFILLALFYLAGEHLYAGTADIIQRVGENHQRVVLDYLIGCIKASMNEIGEINNGAKHAEICANRQLLVMQEMIKIIKRNRSRNFTLKDAKKFSLGQVEFMSQTVNGCIYRYAEQNKLPVQTSSNKFKKECTSSYGRYMGDLYISLALELMHE